MQRGKRATERRRARKQVRRAGTLVRISYYVGRKQKKEKEEREKAEKNTRIRSVSGESRN